LSFIVSSKITPAANAASLRVYPALCPPCPKRYDGGPSINFAPQWGYIWLGHVTRGLLGSGFRSPFSWAYQQIQPQTKLNLLSWVDKKALFMEISVVTARCGSVLWRGKKESRDYKEYLVVKMPLYQFCAPDLH
jgi:hypothetical protein